MCDCASALLHIVRQIGVGTCCLPGPGWEENFWECQRVSLYTNQALPAHTNMLRQPNTYKNADRKNNRLIILEIEHSTSREQQDNNLVCDGFHILGQLEGLHFGHICVHSNKFALDWTCDTENTEQTATTGSEENKCVIAESHDCESGC